MPLKDKSHFYLNQIILYVIVSIVTPSADHGIVEFACIIRGALLNREVAGNFFVYFSCISWRVCMKNYLKEALEIVKAQASVRIMTEQEITTMVRKLSESIRLIGGGENPCDGNRRNRA